MAFIIIIFGYKVYHIVLKSSAKFGKISYNDKYTLVMIIFMTLVMVTRCIYHSVNAMANNSQSGFWNNHVRMDNILQFLPVAMMSMTCSINVRNWIHYFIKIKEAAYARKREEYDELNELRLQSFHKRSKMFQLDLRIGITIYFLLTLFSLIYIILISFLYKKDDEE